jgi:hypothetical protein
MIRTGRNSTSARGALLRLCAVCAFALLAATLFSMRLSPAAQAAGPNAIVYAPGWDANSLPPNDDESTGLVALPFPINFFGNTYNSLYVNNNGNVTFDRQLSTYTPFPIQTTGIPMIAPFFGDVWTIRCGDQTRGTDVVHYGSIQFQGRQAFSVTWAGVGVGYYQCGEDKLNHFQMLLIDRSDVGAGDFDIVFNYDQIQWETGDASGGIHGLGGNSARIGFSNGTNTSFELPGSAVNGAFLDSNPNGLIYGSRNTLQRGRYVFPVRNGAAPTGVTLSGTVFGSGPAPANVLAGAFVQVCGDGSSCLNAVTNSLGRYSVSGLARGFYAVSVNPPGGRNLEPRATQVELNNDLVQDFTLAPPPPSPPGIVEPAITNVYGNQVVHWHNQLNFITPHTCPNAITANMQITVLGILEYIGASAPMTETAPGSGIYTASVPPLYPLHGPARVMFEVICEDNSLLRYSSAIYIDPSGVVQDTHGHAVEGATVTLYRADSAGGPFDQVPDGSGIMSPANQHNPDVTDGHGVFGWDVISGFYKVRAEKEGCRAPGDAGQPFAETGVLTIPPPVTDLVLTLDCGEPADSTPPVITPNVSGTLGDNGYYTSNVNVSWTVTDAESAVSNTTGCDAQTVSADTNGVTFTCSATSAGGTSSQSVTVKRDATPPVIRLASRSPGANSYGWNNTAVTVRWNCADATSGAVSPGVSQTVGAEGQNQSATGTCTDAAGNTASDTVSGISIDKTPPALVPSVSPNPVLLNGSATAAANAGDSLSGIATQSCGAVGSATVGSKTVACTATDKAGNSADGSVSYSVTYGIRLLYDSTQAKNVGSTYPVKLQLVDAAGVNYSVVGITLQGLGVVQSPGNSQPDNLFRFTDGDYQFNVQTSGLAPGNYLLAFAVSGDPVRHTAPFSVR